MPTTTHPWTPMDTHGHPCMAHPLPRSHTRSKSPVSPLSVPAPRAQLPGVMEEAIPPDMQREGGMQDSLGRHLFCLQQATNTRKFFLVITFFLFPILLLLSNASLRSYLCSPSLLDPVTDALASIPPAFCSLRLRSSKRVSPPDPSSSRPCPSPGLSGVPILRRLPPLVLSFHCPFNSSPCLIYIHDLNLTPSAQDPVQPPRGCACYHVWTTSSPSTSHTQAPSSSYTYYHGAVMASLKNIINSDDEHDPSPRTSMQPLPSDSSIATDSYPTTRPEHPTPAALQNDLINPARHSSSLFASGPPSHSSSGIAPGRRPSNTSVESMDGPFDPTYVMPSGSSFMRPMQRNSVAEHSVKLTPITRKISKAKKGQPVHNCDKCSKV